MHARVGNQSTGCRERLAARQADMRLLPRVRAHVRHQVAGHRERLAARFADIRLLPRVCPHVHSQAAGRRERLAALVADVAFLPSMRALLRFSARRVTAIRFAAARVAALLPRNAASSSLRCAAANSMFVHVCPSPHDASLFLWHHLEGFEGICLE